MADIQNDLMLRGKIAAFSTMIAALTGEQPAINYTPEFAQIEFTEQQKQILQSMIERELKAKPGSIRINYNSIFFPPVFRVYGKYALMALIAAFLLGKLSN